MINPQYVKIREKKYKINTSYLVAIECNEIAQDNSIGDYERCLAVIYRLFGEEGLNSSKDWEKLIELGMKYLLLGNTEKETENSNSQIDMDYIEDMNYIKASFMYDYGIDLDKNQDMHWWTFYNLLNGLSNSEFGNCCILSRVRNIRNTDTSKIKDLKTRTEIEKMKKIVALHKKEKQATDKQKESMNKAYELLGL